MSKGGRGGLWEGRTQIPSPPQLFLELPLTFSKFKKSFSKTNTEEGGGGRAPVGHFALVIGGYSRAFNGTLVRKGHRTGPRQAAWLLSS